MNINGSVEESVQGDLETTIKNQVACQLSQYNSPWFRYYLDYDPVPKLEKVKCPVLMIFGELDLQVPTDMNKDVMVEALKRGGNKNYALKIFADANHLYQHAKTGSPAEYGDLDKKFVPGFLEFLSNWIVKHVDIVT
jgi:dipeptidyl aminopeptidase/acylaminoacyl peptidase